MHIDLTLERAALSAQRRAARRTPWIPVLTALMNLADGKAELVRHAECNWASATFSGARHSVVLAFNGTEAVTTGEALIDALPEHEFTIPRHLVADATVVAVAHSVLPEPRLEVTLELLLLEDG